MRGQCGFSALVRYGNVQTYMDVILVSRPVESRIFEYLQAVRVFQLPLHVAFSRRRGADDVAHMALFLPALLESHRAIAAQAQHGGIDADDGKRTAGMAGGIRGKVVVRAVSIPIDRTPDAATKIHFCALGRDDGCF